MQVERYLPHEVMAKAGLLQEPSSCSFLISNHQPDGSSISALIDVALSDLGQVPIPITNKSFMVSSAASVAEVDTEMTAELTYRPSSNPNEEMESARIKSELASYIVAACLRDINITDSGTWFLN